MATTSHGRSSVLRWRVGRRARGNYDGRHARGNLRKRFKEITCCAMDPSWDELGKWVIQAILLHGSIERMRLWGHRFGHHNQHSQHCQYYYLHHHDHRYRCFTIIGASILRSFSGASVLRSSLVLPFYDNKLLDHAPWISWVRVIHVSPEQSNCFQNQPA